MQEKKALSSRAPQGRGNILADKTAKQAAEGMGIASEAPIKVLVLAELPELALDSPKYTEAQNQLAKADVWGGGVYVEAS